MVPAFTPADSTKHLPATPYPTMPASGPGGGGQAPPELVESDRCADPDDLSDGGANSSRHTGDAAKERSKSR